MMQLAYIGGLVQASPAASLDCSASGVLLCRV